MAVDKPIVGAFDKAAIESVFSTRVNSYGCSGASEVASRVQCDHMVNKKDKPARALGLKSMAKQKTNLLKLVSEKMLTYPLKAMSREADCDWLGVWELGHG
jgi:hypothetical protein